MADNINAAKENVASLQSNKQAVCADTLRQLNAGMRLTLTSHHQMINDVRSVLKTMAKVFFSFKFIARKCPVF